MVGRSRYSLPLSPSLEQKFDALSAELEVRVLASSDGGARDRSSVRSRPRDPPARARRARVLRRCCRSVVARELRAFRPDAVLGTGCAGGGAVRPRSEARADLDAGDRGHPRRSWRRPPGSTGRRCEGRSRRSRMRSRAPGCAEATGCGRSPRTHRASFAPAGIEPTAEFAAFMDLEPFVESRPAPLPERPGGALRRRARALQGGRRPRRRLAPCRTAGPGRDAAPRGPRDAPRRPSGTRPGTPGADPLDRVALDAGGRPSARRVDGARAPLSFRGPRTGRRRGVLPRPRCRREPRRRHPGHRRGGRDRPPRSTEDVDALADALVRVLTDGALAERLGGAAHEAVQPWLATPQEYARRIRELVDEVTS